jgi:8-oxo-dGTP diphosphatase
MADELTGEVRAAGGVVWRLRDNSNVEIAVIHRPKYDDWSFPKGKLDPEESFFDGAVREVLEETGYRVRPSRSLGEVRYVTYSSGGLRPKIVRYWAMQATTGTFAPNHEVDDLRWVTADEAMELLTRENDGHVLERFLAGPIVTGTVLLVRHGSAGSRSKWKGDDRDRPLDETGRDQAEALIGLLSGFDVRDLVSADFARCVQTLEPFARSRNVEIREEPLLSEQGFPGHEEQAVASLRELANPGAAVAACSQRQVMPKLLERLAVEDEVELPHLRAKKGSVWALAFDDRRLCQAEYFPPPIETRGPRQLTRQPPS